MNINLFEKKKQLESNIEALKQELSDLEESMLNAMVKHIIDNNLFFGTKWAIDNVKDLDDEENYVVCSCTSSLSEIPAFRKLAEIKKNGSINIEGNVILDVVMNHYGPDGDFFALNFEDLNQAVEFSKKFGIKLDTTYANNYIKRYRNHISKMEFILNKFGL